MSAPNETYTLYNANWSVNYWLSLGFPRDKIVLGLATYGRVFKLRDSQNNRVYSLNSGAGVKGEVKYTLVIVFVIVLKIENFYFFLKFTREAGFLSYFEICKNLKNGWNEEWSEDSKVPFAYSSDEWVGFENIKSLTLKVILNKKLYSH